MWIRSHRELAEHPKFKKLTRLLGCVPEAQVYGHLHLLWHWAVTYAPDGDISSIDCEEIASAARWCGDASVFVDALAASHFIDRDGSATVFHDWEENCASMLEKRARDAARKRASRQSRADGAKCPSDVRVTGSDVRREIEIEMEIENISPHTPRQGGNAGAGSFGEFWSAYPRHIDQSKAYRCWCRLMKEGIASGDIIAAAQRYAEECEADRTPEKYIKHPKTFLGRGELWKEYAYREDARADRSNSATATASQEEATAWRALVS